MCIAKFLDNLKSKYKIKSVADIFNKWREAPKKQEVIVNFHIPCNEERYLTNDIYDVQAFVEKLQQTEFLEGTIAKTKLRDAQAYRKILDSYKKQIDKIAKKNPTEFDEDELAESYVNMAVKPLRDMLLVNLAVALYRSLNYIQNNGTEQDAKDLLVIINALNKYLESCGVYTRILYTGNRPQDQDIDEMEKSDIGNGKPGEAGTIAEVERLPYFLKYMDEDGEVVTKCIKGKFSVFRA